MNHASCNLYLINTCINQDEHRDLIQGGFGLTVWKYAFLKYVFWKHDFENHNKAFDKTNKNVLFLSIKCLDNFNLKLLFRV